MYWQRVEQIEKDGFVDAYQQFTGGDLTAPHQVPI
jgi:hypothetical protein